MTKFTSRPNTVTVTSDQQLMIAATPAKNMVAWVSKLVAYPDDSRKSIINAKEMIIEVLECLMLFDHEVIIMPSPSSFELHYEIKIKPIENARYVSFKTIFLIQP